MAVFTIFKRGFTDKEIIDAINQGEGGEDRVLSFLYKESLPAIRKYIINNQGSIDEANDIFQDALLRFYHSVKQGNFKGSCSVKTFLFGISKNLWINYLQKKGRSTREHEWFTIEDKIDIEGELISTEKSKAVNDLLGILGDRCEQLLKYSVYDNLSMKEIAIKMGFANENVAKTNNYRCKQKLMLLITENKQLKQLFDR